MCISKTKINCVIFLAQKLNPRTAIAATSSHRRNLLHGASDGGRRTGRIALNISIFWSLFSLSYQQHRKRNEVKK